MSTLIDQLLQADVKKVTELPTAKYEVKRLSKLLKAKFEMELCAIPAKRYTEIQQNSVDLGRKGNVKDLKMFNLQALTLIDGIKEPSMKNPELLRYYSAATPKDLVAKLFLSGEIADIYGKINELSGYEPDTDETEKTVKN